MREPISQQYFGTTVFDTFCHYAPKGSVRCHSECIFRGDCASCGWRPEISEERLKKRFPNNYGGQK